MRKPVVLGLNSRNHLYTAVYNSKSGKRVANSKLETKKALKKVGLRVPKTYGVIESDEELSQFDFMKLPKEGFVIKPNNGLGGEGIVVIEEPDIYAGEWITTEGKSLSVRDLELHTDDILQGRYSMNDLPDTAYIEELVSVHPVFSKYSYHGTPDIRVIVFNQVPVMAMLRLATRESGGRANLHQGAVGAGIDIATGITTYAIHHSKPIAFLPGTRRRLKKIEIPRWREVLELAVACQNHVKLGYLGVDIVLQTEKKKDGKLKTTPMVLELNAQPGLKIQLANRAGLWERLERVEGLMIDSVNKGVRVGQSLFADPKLRSEGLRRKMVKSVEEVELVGYMGERVKLEVKIDTGADSSSIDRELAGKLGLLRRDNLLYEKFYKSALGRRKRQVVEGKFYLAGRKIKTRFSVTDRSRMRYKMIVGRRDLSGFLVMPEK